MFLLEQLAPKMSWVTYPLVDALVPGEALWHQIQLPSFNEKECFAPGLNPLEFFTQSGKF